jgi:hypothetical protein
MLCDRAFSFEREDSLDGMPSAIREPTERVRIKAVTPLISREMHAMTPMIENYFDDRMIVDPMIALHHA